MNLREGEDVPEPRINLIFHPFILKILHASVSAFNLPRHRMSSSSSPLSSPSYRLGYNLSTSSFWSRSPTCRIWAFADQAECLSTSSRRLLADQCLSRSGGGGARRVNSRSTKESHWRSHSEWWERRLAGRGQAWLLGRQHQLWL